MHSGWRPEMTAADVLRMEAADDHRCTQMEHLRHAI
jgi:hypothetical protein